jgi:hypothetical protein
MSFKLARLIHFASSIMVGLLFFVLGIIGLMLAWSPSFRSGTAQFFFEHTLLSTLLSFGLAIAGFLLFVYPFLIERKRYIHISSGPYAVSLDENVIHRYLTAYWEKLFPGKTIPFELQSKKKSIQIVADLPSLPIEQQKLFIEQIQKDLEDLFNVQLGCPHEIHLLVSFQ